MMQGQEPSNRDIMAQLNELRGNLYGSANGHEGDLPRLFKTLEDMRTENKQDKKELSANDTKNREAIIQLRLIVALVVTALGGGAGIAKLLMS